VYVYKHVNRPLKLYLWYLHVIGKCLYYCAREVFMKGTRITRAITCIMCTRQTIIILYRHYILWCAVHKSPAVVWIASSFNNVYRYSQNVFCEAKSSSSSSIIDIAKYIFILSLTTLLFLYSILLAHAWSCYAARFYPSFRNPEAISYTS